jgi:hypothetical protein
MECTASFLPPGDRSSMHATGQGASTEKSRDVPHRALTSAASTLLMLVFEDGYHRIVTRIDSHRGRSDPPKFRRRLIGTQAISTISRPAKIASVTGRSSIRGANRPPIRCCWHDEHELVAGMRSNAKNHERAAYEHRRPRHRDSKSRSHTAPSEIDSVCRLLTPHRTGGREFERRYEDTIGLSHGFNEIRTKTLE